MIKLFTLFALLVLCANSVPAAMTIQAPKRSQSTAEAGNATLIDEGSRRLPVYGVVYPDANGVTSLPAPRYVAGKVSPVTGKEEPARYRLNTGVEIPLIALTSINTSTNVAGPFTAPASGVTLAGDVTGPASASVVALVGGQAAATVASATSTVSSATNVPTASTIAKRDASGAARFSQIAESIVALGDFATGGSVGSAASTVDVAGLLTVGQTTAAQTLTLPSPTFAGAARVLYIYNSGSASFDVLGATVAAGAAQGALWNGSAWVAL